jgi:ribosomal protein S17E
MESLIHLFIILGGVYTIIRFNRADLKQTEDKINENLKEVLKLKFEVNKTEFEKHTEQQMQPTKNFLDSLTNMLKNQNIKVPEIKKGDLNV